MFKKLVAAIIHNGALSKVFYTVERVTIFKVSHFKFFDQVIAFRIVFEICWLLNSTSVGPPCIIVGTPME